MFGFLAREPGPRAKYEAIVRALSIAVDSRDVPGLGAPVWMQDIAQIRADQEIHDVLATRRLVDPRGQDLGGSLLDRLLGAFKRRTTGGARLHHGFVDEEAAVFIETMSILQSHAVDFLFLQCRAPSIIPSPEAMLGPQSVFFLHVVSGSQNWARFGKARAEFASVEGWALPSLKFFDDLPGLDTAKLWREREALPCRVAGKALYKLSRENYVLYLRWLMAGED